MSTEAYQIRRMTPDDVAIATEWARREGWNPGLHDAHTFYQADPNGFFIGEINGEAVAVGCAIIYDEAFAFCGLYIVAPEHRGEGYGFALTEARLAYCGSRNIGIDGVLENVGIYERIGYRKFYENARYQFMAGEASVRPANLVALSQVDAEALKRYDRQCFPAARDTFLNAWISQPDALSLAWMEQGQLKGYAVRRRCHEGHKIGPLFADNPLIAEQLLLACQEGVQGQSLIVDMPETNDAALKLAASYRMERTFATARMYQKGLPELAYDKIFGITTFELG
ncbi:MAG: acetyltransferase [Candidatus Entotheonella factor]|uniref:Acetyltransferase n=1 Tax=Entotheonella factor TaxID=1429438 RepID=W4LH66_ENTF1|nr:GNAT family N-acetyltransferase [Candidatus Entotheonella palauensis]ETW96681.1 MAG: acetyltransferase [Candidatus Entotheonella factor]